MTRTLLKFLGIRLPLKWALLIFAIAFVFSRAAFWFYLPYPDLNEDSLEYLLLAFRMANGEAPSAHFIGLGYPFLFYLYRLFFQDVTYFFVFQSILSFASICILMRSFSTNKGVPLLIFLPTFFYLISDHCIRWEMNYTPDSVISSFMVLMAGLFFLFYSYRQHLLYILAISLVAVFLISVRSSNVNLVAVLLTMSGMLIANRWYKASFLLMGICGLGLLGLSTYNRIFSQDKVFSFITYGRLATDIDSTSSRVYKEGFNSNSKPVIVPKVQPNPYSFSPVFTSWIQRIPKNTYVWRHFFAWKPHERTRATLDSRYYKIHTRVVGPKSVCIELPSLTDCEVKLPVPYGNPEEWADSIRVFRGLRPRYAEVSLNALAYSFNLSYPQGKVYHGGINHNFKYTGSRELDPLRSFYSDQKWQPFIHYVWGAGVVVQQIHGLEEGRFKARNHPILKFAPSLLSLGSVFFYSTFYSLLFLLALILTPFILLFRRKTKKINTIVLLSVFFISHAALFSLFGVLPRYSSITEPFQYLLPFILLLEFIPGWDKETHLTLDKKAL